MGHADEFYYAIREFSTDTLFGEAEGGDASGIVSRLNEKYGARFYCCEPKSRSRRIDNRRLDNLINAMVVVHAHSPGSATTVCRGSLRQLNAEFVDPATQDGRVNCEFCLIAMGQARVSGHK